MFANSHSTLHCYYPAPLCHTLCILLKLQYSPSIPPLPVQGDTFRVTVTNAVDGPNAPATNMHFHGFFVSPQHGQADPLPPAAIFRVGVAREASRMAHARKSLINCSVEPGINPRNHPAVPHRTLSPSLEPSPVSDFLLVPASESLRLPPYPSPSESLYPGKPLQLPPYPSPSGSLYLQLSPYPSPSAVSESLRRIRVSPSPSAGRRRHHGHTARRLLHLLCRGAGRALPRSILVLPPPHKHWQPVTPLHAPLPRAENAPRLPCKTAPFPGKCRCSVACS